MDRNLLVFSRNGQLGRLKIRELLDREGLDAATIASILKVIDALNQAVIRKTITREVALERAEIVIESELGNQRWVTPLTCFDTTLSDLLGRALDRADKEKKGK